MNRLLVPLITLTLFLSMPADAQRQRARAQGDSGGQKESYDYWKFNREMIRRGQQAILMCNGLFTSNRSLEQVFEKELAYLSEPIGTPTGGDYSVDWVARRLQLDRRITCRRCARHSARGSAA